MIKNFFKHFFLVTRHRMKVFSLCARCGLIWRGLTHDLSKYSIEEFFESIKYYSGNHSPLANCKKANGYSKAWLHHIGRNKHHYEYWYDYDTPIKTPIIPYKYVVEMICDGLAAGLVYQGKNWESDYQLNYWNRAMERNGDYVHPLVIEYVREIYKEVSENGIKKVINKRNLKNKYKTLVKDNTKK